MAKKEKVIAPAVALPKEVEKFLHGSNCEAVPVIGGIALYVLDDNGARAWCCKVHAEVITPELILAAIARRK